MISPNRSKGAAQGPVHVLLFISSTNAFDAIHKEKSRILGDLTNIAKNMYQPGPLQWRSIDINVNVLYLLSPSGANLLVDTSGHHLRIADFGAAARMMSKTSIPGKSAS